VEDSHDTAESLIHALRLRGHDVLWCATVRDARLVLRDDVFAKGVLDLNLPDGLGTELLPLPFPACIYSGLPDDAEGYGVPVFSKSDPFALLDWIEGKEKP